MVLPPALQRSLALPQRFQRERPSIAVANVQLILGISTKKCHLQVTGLHGSHDRSTHWHILSDTQCCFQWFVSGALFGYL